VSSSSKSQRKSTPSTTANPNKRRAEPTRETKVVSITRNDEVRPLLVVNESRPFRQGHKVVNHYVVLGKLGTGAYSKVKLCMDLEDSSPYALKVGSPVVYLSRFIAIHCTTRSATSLSCGKSVSAPPQL
jgi:serine/threonine protein kinase